MVMDKARVPNRLCGGWWIHLSSSESDPTSGSAWTTASPQPRALHHFTQEHTAQWPVHMHHLKHAGVKLFKWSSLHLTFSQSLWDLKKNKNLYFKPSKSENHVRIFHCSKPLADEQWLLFVAFWFLTSNLWFVSEKQLQLPSEVLWIQRSLIWLVRVVYTAVVLARNICVFISFSPL